jgi:hypothetical protein
MHSALENCSILTPVLLLQHALFLAAKDIVVAGMTWKLHYRKDECYYFLSHEKAVISTFHLQPVVGNQGSREQKRKFSNVFLNLMTQIEP